MADWSIDLKFHEEPMHVPRQPSLAMIETALDSAQMEAA